MTAQNLLIGDPQVQYVVQNCDTTPSSVKHPRTVVPDQPFDIMSKLPSNARNSISWDLFTALHASMFWTASTTE